MSSDKVPPPSQSPPLDRKYANYFQIGQNAFEVVLECGQYNEGDAEPRLHTSVITTPAHAKKLLQLLEDCLREYEEVYGALPEE